MQFEFSIYYKLTTQMCTNTIQTCRPLATVISQTELLSGEEKKRKANILLGISLSCKYLCK